MHLDEKMCWEQASVLARLTLERASEGPRADLLPVSHATAISGIKRARELPRPQNSSLYSVRRCYDGGPDNTQIWLAA